MEKIEELYPDIICPISKEIMKNPVITDNGNMVLDVVVFSKAYRCTYKEK